MPAAEKQHHPGERFDNRGAGEKQLGTQGANVELNRSEENEQKA